MSGALRFLPSEADLRAAYALHMARPKFKQILWLMSFGILLATIFSLLEKEYDPFVVLLVVLAIWAWMIIVACAIWAAMWFVWLPRFSKRVYAQQKDLRDDTEIAWDAEAFSVTSDSGQSRLAWDGFHGWKRTEDMLLLYRSEAMFNFVPLKDAAFVKAADEIVGHLQAAGVKAK